jgi:hypothetical protein
MSNTSKKRKVKDVTTTKEAPAPVQKRGRQLPARVSDEMNLTLEGLAAQERRKVAQMVVILLEDALAARGLWPPKPGGAKGGVS